MGKFVDNVKASFWNLINAPGADDIDDDTDWEYEDEKAERSNDRSYRDRDREMYDDEYGNDPPPLRWKEKQEKPERRPTSARQAQNNKVLEMHGKASSHHTEVIIRHPMDVAEAAKICDCIRDDKMCVIDLTGMDRSMAQRIADFLGGACYALDGCVQRVSRDIFIIVPDGVRITADLQDELEKDGYVFPSRVRR